MARRIYLGREVSKYAEIAGGAIITITSLFFVLMFMGFEITGTDDICLGTLEDPCVSYGKICNLGPDNYDIYNPDEIKMDFSPTVKNFWIFFKDGRVKKQFLYELGVNASTEGWRYENFTDATKPRKDRVYVHRFARYSCQEYMLVGLKSNENDVIKWGMGVGAEYFDPFWYGVNETPNNLVSGSLNVELGTLLNISTNITGCDTVCVDIDHPDYGDNYTCGSPTANFEVNISYFRNNEFNDSTTAQNLTFTVAENQTVWISSHQYDEIKNVSINLTGYNYSLVNIYINNSLSNAVGELFNGIITLDELGYSAPFVGQIVNATNGTYSGSCVECDKAYDNNWTSYALTTGLANFTINYSIPTDSKNRFSANTTWKWGGVAEAPSTDRLQVYCYNNNSLVQFVTNRSQSTTPSINFTDNIPTECFDDESVLRILYELTASDKFFDSEIQWYDKVSLIEFDFSGVETFTVNISSRANVTSAIFNISGSLYENALDQEAITEHESYTVSYQPEYAWSQRFTPAYPNLSRVAVYVDKTLLSNEGDLTVKVGTTANSSDIGSGAISYGDISYSAISSSSPDWEYISLDADLVVGGVYYITLSGPIQLTTRGYRWYSSDAYDGVYDRGGMTLKGTGETNLTGDFAFRTYVDKFPENITLEIGEVDGDYEWNYTGEFKTEETVSDFSTELNDYLINCSSVDGYCQVPAYLTSVTAGSLVLDEIEINYTSDSNPIYLDISLIEDYLNSSINATNIPIIIEADRATKIGVSDLKFDHMGGNDTIEILTYNATDVVDKTVNDTLDLIVYYSSFFKNLPYTWITDVFFLPTTNSSKNVTAYGQTTSKPIYNLTTTNYGGKNMNLSIKINESISCLNITWSLSSTINEANILNTSWQTISSLMGYSNNTQIWMWANLENCNASSRVLNPSILLESYCEDCVWSGQ